LILSKRTVGMADNDEAIRRLFDGVRAFSWHEVKRRENLRKHRIDFDDARHALDGPTYIRRSDRYGEIRYQVFGLLEGREITFVCTVEIEICRIISARRARKDERRRYYGRLARRSPAGKD
jgi:uncharacterized DUF497 family protein